ncbi:MAG TPA: Crp/Fnr family transcriptional regulator [Flavobacteriales bacterium]|nr:Crp/Fnr family transcriptional regulator [Flavobacteriales bacterium]
MAFTVEKYHFGTESIFERLPVKDLKLLKDQMVRMEIKKDRVLFREGNYSRGIYILRKGKIKMFQLNKSGEEQIIYIYRKGEILGYRPLLSHEVHAVSATALDDCVISFIPKKYFLEILERSLPLSRSLLTNLAHEFAVWVNTFNVLAQQPVKERVALVLLILNEKYRRNNETQVTINLSRDNMARYARTTVETLARMLRHFKDEKLIKTEGRKIIVLRPAELAKIAEFY